MCVIMLASAVRPTEEMITRAWDHNKDGAGIAWREKDEVVWQKGVMKLDEIQELCLKTPLPYVAHFRVASVGGVKDTLTHPFQVSLEARLDLKGRTKGAVLFHNGHWSQWNDKLIDAIIHSNNQAPEGSDWSDSRAMAWMVKVYGAGFMELLTTQKGVLMTPKKFNVFTGNGWDKINNVWCSNDFFWVGRRYSGTQNQSYSRLCSVGRCTNKPMPGRDICHSCDKQRKDAADTIAKEGDSTSNTVGQSTSAVELIKGGPTDGPLEKILTLEDVEGFYRNKMLSRNKLKAFRKLYNSRHEKGNRGLRALTRLRELSEDIAQSLIETGSVN